MSARDELFRRLALPFADEDRVNKLIDDYAHELAEKIRERAVTGPRGFTLRPEYAEGFRKGRDAGADLIDPEVP